MNSLQVEEDWKRLHEILATMDFPRERKDDLNWMCRNLGIKNKDHPDFDEAMTIIKSKLKDIAQTIRKINQH